MGTATRIPGILFETVTPPPRTRYPRMDIAGFVGFAASGPLDVPVMVEDIERFHEIFGRDLNLAWDPHRGEMLQAHLAPAVRSFFRQGGRRCWVVRVAGNAATTRFLLPGALRVPAGSVDARSAVGAVAQARSAGSWADDCTVNTRLIKRNIALTRQSETGGHTTWKLGAGESVEPGSLLGIASGDSISFLPVTAASAGACVTSPGFRFERMVVSPALAVTATYLSADGEPATPLPQFGSDGAKFLLRIPPEIAAVATIGGFFRIQFAGGVLAYLQAERYYEEDNSGFSWVESVRVWREGSVASLPAVTAASLTASVFTMDLEVLRGTQVVSRFEGLGFTPGHLRYIGLLPGDEQLLGPATGERPALWAEATHPRFPLACPETGVLLPLGMLEIARPEFAQPAIFEGTALERDGLASMEPSLFLDAKLRNTRPAVLPAAARRYMLSIPSEIGAAVPADDRLTKLHALWPVDEVSLIAIPDAVHPGWELVDDEWSQLAAPEIEQAEILADGRYLLRWKPVATATEYQLQSAQDPRFLDARAEYSGPDLSRQFDPSPACVDAFYYRVRALRRGVVSPWSSTAARQTRSFPFTQCIQGLLPQSVLSIQSLGRSRFRMTWTSAGAGAIYRLETAADPEFLGASAAYVGPNLEVVLTMSRMSCFRVAAKVGAVDGPWSNTVIWAPGGTSRWQVKAVNPQSAEDAADASLLAIHRALVWMCAARGDAMALLTLSAHYREKAALTHRMQLESALEEDDEGLITSFAALYHPWLLTTDASGASQRASRPMPPDGAACGVIAARALRRGAWLSPGNQPIEEVLALVPEFTPQAVGILLGAQVNMVVDRPRGFIALGADTLSRFRQLSSIHVRRLLILLRRLALRDGPQFVFESNDAIHQRTVRRHFEQILSDMFVLGAFAGESQQEGFRVSTDSSATDVDEGRMVVTLKIAPSAPLQFLTVRLVRSGSESLSLEVA
ncbi:MAG: hypothetical protein U0R19_27835 [Bryobacteraceae bacterium]